MAEHSSFFVDPKATCQTVKAGEDFGKIKTPSRLWIAGYYHKKCFIILLFLSRSILIHVFKIYKTFFVFLCPQCLENLSLL